MINLDEAIKHCEEVAENQEWLSESYDDDSMGTKLCKECASDHRQLAEWLKKLQAYEKAREEIIRRKYSDQWSKTVVIHIIDKHLKEVNADDENFIS